MMKKPDIYCGSWIARLDPETDDDDVERQPNTPDVHPGVDGGFFTGEDDDHTTSHDSADGVHKLGGPKIGTRLGDDDDGGTELDRVGPRHPIEGPVSRRPSFPVGPDFEGGNQSGVCF